RSIGRILMMTTAFGMVLPWLLIAVGAWLGYQIVRQNGRILLRLESLEKRLALGNAGARAEAPGLSVGTPAPGFELPALAGTPRELSSFRGEDVLLIFFNPKCGFCAKRAADWAALPLEPGGGRAIPIVVTTGNADENRQLVEQWGVRCIVLRQEQME